MASAKPKKSDTPGIMDVSKPGKSAPSATSRPIIINNRPILQDPMVVEDQAGVDSGTSPSKGKATIQPINVSSGDSDSESIAVTNSTKVAEPGDVATEVAAPEEPKAELAPEADTASETEKTKEPTPEKSEEVADKPDAAATTEAAVPATPQPEEANAEQGEAASEKPEQDTMTPEQQEAAAKKAEEEIAAHNAEIEKLVESEQYFLPINSVETRKTKRFIAMGAVLIVVLGLAWLDIALDAGLVHIAGIKALTHFFTSQ